MARSRRGKNGHCSAALGAILSLGAPAALAQERPAANPVPAAQVPTWSADDMQFFLHGSMSTEVVPENVLKAFRATYPDLLPGRDLSAFGAIAVPGGDLPIGFSRREVPHLGGLRSLGINCASCHVGRVASPGGGEPLRILGVTSQFDPEAFFGAVIAGTFRTAEVANMMRFLKSYLEACDPQAPGATRATLAAELGRQSQVIAAIIASHRAEERGMPPDALLELDAATLVLDRRYLDNTCELAPLVRSLMRLFHNMRAALHVPHQPPPPEQAPPRSGPGRNNAFGTLSLALFGEPAAFGPAKFGLCWNLQQRTWVHWDGNTRSPIVRNLAASLGLGAPLIGKRAILDFAGVERHTQLTERILPPRYPGAVDAAMAARGRLHFEAACARCPVRPQAEEDARLFALEEVKTDPNRARIITDHQAQLYNRLFGELELAGYQPPDQAPVRSTEKYVAVDLAGVWARSPYLHNGSVRTMTELLAPASKRAKKFRRGTIVYDQADLGYADDGPYILDTTTPGNTNAGHEYGTSDLTDEQKRELIEYLKTL